jgi:hypothetical protein
MVSILGSDGGGDGGIYRRGESESSPVAWCDTSRIASSLRKGVKDLQMELTC